MVIIGKKHKKLIAEMISGFDILNKKGSYIKTQKRFSNLGIYPAFMDE